MQVEEAILTRRTHKTYDGSEVRDEELRALISAATWAPNHRHTEPWRFAVIRGRSRETFADVIDTALNSMRKPDGEADQKITAKKKKFRRRLQEAAALVLVTYVRSRDDDLLDREDYAATACAIQNLQLAATGRGLVCLWSTSGVFKHDVVRHFAGWNEDEELVGAVFIGRPKGELQGRRTKSVEDIARWL